MPNVVVTAQLPLLVVVTSVIFFRSLRRGAERLPFLTVLMLFLLNYVGLGISIYPYLVPRAITLWDAAAPPESQAFLLVGVALIMPVILAYTGWAYLVFRGKVGTRRYHG
jgi:cytochrome bd ubiquinol oxidase subunit II